MKLNVIRNHLKEISLCCISSLWWNWCLWHQRLVCYCFHPKY